MGSPNVTIGHSGLHANDALWNKPELGNLWREQEAARVNGYPPRDSG